MTGSSGHKLGWIGTGRMGFPMAKRLLEKGCDLAVYNRTRSKAEGLSAYGGRIVDSPAALADRDIVFLGVVAQSLAEITVLAEKAGVPRHAFLDFINKSVMGSTFTRYKAPAFVNLDFTPTFTPVLLRKDLDLGLAEARKREVPMPLAALVREIVQGLIGTGAADRDFAALLELEAKSAQLRLKPENVPVTDGLEEKREASPRAGMS